MAYFGLSKPWIAKYNPETDRYTDGFKCGKAISTSITPNYNETSLYADNQQTENVTEFKNASISLGVDRMPIQAASIVFGHTVSADGEVVSKTGDSANYVGYGFVTAEMQDGIQKYQACLIRKVKFKESEESYDTKGDSIVFKTPTLSGTAMGTSKTDWRKKSPYFETEEDADGWLQIQLDVIERCENPVASVPGGTYTEEKIVTLTTGTKGAKIVYTTNGTTPSESNGEEYADSIVISESTGLRAVTLKEGAAPSDVVMEEYLIITATPGI